MKFLELVFILSGFIIFWAMIGYPFSLTLLDKLYDKKTEKNYDHKPSVTVMVVAHNEEKVIEKKLKNLLDLDYPRDKIKFIVASDYSTDSTNEIVSDFIASHPEIDIKLHKTQERKGKTNAQNEAQKLVDTEFLVLTDANAMLERNAIKELMASFTSSDIAYVTGKVIYVNDEVSLTSNSESLYWSADLKMREIESKIQAITAGNGALYACRNNEYFDFDPIFSHDIVMPLHYAMGGKRAIANHEAVAYEKAGENVNDEFKRKVRMNRMMIKFIVPDFRMILIHKYRWFTYFYFGHRTCRYLLWFSHFMLLITNIFLVNDSIFYKLSFLFQMFFYLIVLIQKKLNIKSKLLNMMYYYCVTLAAQWVAVFRIISGKSKPFWDKAESTR